MKVFTTNVQLYILQVFVIAPRVRVLKTVKFVLSERSQIFTNIDTV